MLTQMISPVPMGSSSPVPMGSSSPVPMGSSSPVPMGSSILWAAAAQFLWAAAAQFLWAAAAQFLWAAAAFSTGSNAHSAASVTDPPLDRHPANSCPLHLFGTHSPVQLRCACSCCLFARVSCKRSLPRTLQLLSEQRPPHFAPYPPLQLRRPIHPASAGLPTLRTSCCNILL